MRTDMREMSQYGARPATPGDAAGHPLALRPEYADRSDTGSSRASAHVVWTNTCPHLVGLHAAAR